jgi:integrase
VTSAEKGYQANGFYETVSRCGSAALALDFIRLAPCHGPLMVASPSEVEAVIEAAKGNRHGHRDATMILRAAEVCDLRWDQVDFNGAVLHVRRVKNGIPSTHPLVGDEMRALRRHQRESPASPFVFVSERGSPFTTAGRTRTAQPCGGRARECGSLAGLDCALGSTRGILPPGAEAG